MIELCLSSYIQLAECPQCYCGEIRQMLTFLINLTVRKIIIGPIVGYVSLNIIDKIILTPNIFTETRTQDSFWICNLSSCNSLFETNNFGLGAVLLSCLVSELQEPPSPVLKLRTFSRSFDPPVFSSWSQEISMPNLAEIGLSLLEL
jgi:hypothetical protein